MSSSGVGHSPPPRATEIRLAPESIDELALRIGELLAMAPPAPQAISARKKMLSAAEVAELFGVSRRWVYDHAEVLGARRLGSGSRPRLRFDPDEVAERMDGWPPDPAARPGRGDRQRCAAIAEPTRFLRGAELWSSGKQENGRGGAVTPPDPAPSEPAQPRG